MLAIPQETEDLARRLAIKLGKTPEDVVREAVAESAAAAGLVPDITRLDRDAVMAKVEAIIEEYRKLPILDGRSADEIIGYEEHGLPQ